MESRSGGDGDKHVNELRQRKANNSHQKTIDRHRRYNEKRSPKKGRARSPVVVGNEIADSIKKLNASRSKDAAEEKRNRDRERKRIEREKLRLSKKQRCDEEACEVEVTDQSHAIPERAREEAETQVRSPLKDLDMESQNDNSGRGLNEEDMEHVLGCSLHDSKTG